MKTLIVLFLMCSSVCEAQFSFKENRTSLGFMFLAGAADGVRDASMFHMWDANSWWNGRESWENKYKDYPHDMSAAYWGSKNVLVWTTDAPHFFNMLSNQFTSFAVVTYPSNDRRLLSILRDAVIYNATRQLGHTLMYKVVLK